MAIGSIVTIIVSMLMEGYGSCRKRAGLRSRRFVRLTKCCTVVCIVWMVVLFNGLLLCMLLIRLRKGRSYGKI